MTIREALNRATKKLSKSTPASRRRANASRGGSPNLDAEVLLCFVLKKSKEYLYLNPNKHLLRSMLRNYSKLVNLRAQGVPVAYLTKHKEFFGLKFYVDKNVLVPRPETEGLVELASMYISKYIFRYIHKQSLKILDVGTGSGNIIISLAKSLFAYSRELDHHYFASDISTQALAVAKQNAKRHRVAVSFKQSDLLQAWKNQHFDIIVANLPYLAKRTDPSTRFEPTKALIAKNKGLSLYEKLFKQISTLNPLPSTLFLEIGYDQTQAIKKLVTKWLPAYAIKISKDLTGRVRFASLEKKSS